MDNGGIDHYISLQDRLHCLPPVPSVPCIFRVPDHLRRLNQRAYEPEILAIGPYHRGKPNLRLMEERKLWYLRDLLQNGYGESLDQFITGVETVVAEARDCYAEPFVTNDPRDFIEMMVLDGCFIIALFLKCDVRELIHPHDSIFMTPWIRYTLMRDLLLFENQLPLCVLYKLSEIVFGQYNNQQQLFVALAFNVLQCTLWGFSGVKYTEQDILNGIVFNREIKHLLALIHHGLLISNVLSGDANVVLVHPQKPKWKQFLLNLFLCNRFRKKVMQDEVAGSDNKRMPQERKRKQLLLICFSQRSIKFLPRAKKGHDSRTCGEYRKPIRCAVNLQEAGIKFEKAEGQRIGDIDFQNGTIKIPTLRIVDRTESLFRNFTAYEQCAMPGHVIDYMRSNNCWPNFVPDHMKSAEVSPTFVADYLTFMDCLIDSESDVRLLRQCRIIENYLGVDEVVSNMLNRLGDFVVIQFPTGNYSKILYEVNRHCSRPWNVHKANLRHMYFNTPWALVSFLAALLLLFLTLAQTVFAILSFAVHKSQAVLVLLCTGYFPSVFIFWQLFLFGYWLLSWALFFSIFKDIKKMPELTLFS